MRPRTAPRLRRSTSLALLAATTTVLTCTGLALAAADPATPSSATEGAASEGVVGTDQGLVRGIVGDTTRTFRGIPYAAPPTGELRWRSPQRAASWSGVRDATKYADSCAQSEHPVGVASTSEDCLYLDVTTPTQSRKKLPVLIWIHGGSFKNGATRIYGPDRLAAKGDLVVVQVQYRLGAFGFLANPMLDERGRKTSGTYGLEDQQAAMRWVQRNAAAFGGDPGNVTIMGESAGSYSVCDHLASPTAAGLFQRAIMQSGPCAQEWSPTNYAAPAARHTAEKYGRVLAAKLECTTAACLRQVPADRLLAASDQAEYSPVLGGPTLPVTPATALRSGKVNRVPVLHGVNHDEEHGRYGAQEAASGVQITLDEYHAELAKVFGDKADEVYARYPVTQTVPAGLALSTALTDALWSVPAAETNRLLSWRMPTYSFEFAGKAPWYAGLNQPKWPAGSHHLSDVAYQFDLGTIFAPLTPDQSRLADEVIARWSAFARTGNPNIPRGVTWPRTAPLDRTVQSLNPAGVSRTDFYADHQLAFWRMLAS
ncbi:MAG TPA: carboxylesterase family protein [Kribbella sp.]